MAPNCDDSGGIGLILLCLLWYICSPIIIKMKKAIFLLLAVVSGLAAAAQTEPANYAAVVSKFKLFYNNNQPDSLYKMFGPEMKAAMTPDQCKGMVTQFRTQLGNLQQTEFTSYTASLPVAIYKATFQNAPIALSLSLNKQDQMIGLYFRPLKDAAAAPAPPAAAAAKPTAAAADASLTESPVSIKSLSGMIHGTLAMPRNVSGKVPVVLIIAGSGPTDRNGNSPKLGVNGNTYKLLAEGLAKNGIASVRYDKRMVGESIQPGVKEDELRFDDYVDDAVGMINMLSADDRFSKIIVLGHSEGSLIGMLAVRDEPVKGFISVAGAGERADKIVTDQLKSYPQFVQNGFKTILDSLKRGKTTDNVDPALYFIARPSVQKYLASWFRYEPQKVIKAVKIPILILQGTTDLQVTVADADRLKKAKSDATLDIIPGMNHVLKEAPMDKDQNMATYSNPDLPLKPELMTDIVGFINKVN